MFKNQFPNHYVTEEVADGYLVTLETNPWWSSDPMSFPRLILASRAVSLVEDLSRQPLEKLWPIWSFYDKLNCLSVLLSSSAPFFNKAPSDDSLASNQAMEAQLWTSMNRLLQLFKDDIDNTEPFRLSALEESVVKLPVPPGTNLATATLFNIPEEELDPTIPSPHRKRKTLPGSLQLIRES